MIRIGIFDSGLGGLTVLRSLQQKLRDASYIYLGDTARTPYGSKSRTTIVRYSLECQQFLARKEIDLLVVACNTASSLALKEIGEASSVPIVGTIEPSVWACLKTSPRRVVGVIGTRATVGSGVYQARLAELAPQLEVVSVACPLFVPLVEEGVFSGPVVEAAVRLYLQELKVKKVEVVILACTHYPLLKEAISAFLGPEVQVIECSDAIAEEVARRGGAVTAHERGVSTHFYVTDEVSRFNGLANFFLEGKKVEAIQVESLELPHK